MSSPYVDVGERPGIGVRQPRGAGTLRGSAQLYEVVGSASGTWGSSDAHDDQTALHRGATTVALRSEHVGPVASSPAVEYKDGSIYIDSTQMDVDVPVPIRYRDYAAVAVKRPDGALELYRLPRSRRSRKR